MDAVSFAAISDHQVAVLHLSIFKGQLINHDLLSLVWRSQPLSIDVLEVSMPDQLTACQFDFTGRKQFYGFNIEFLKSLYSCLSSFLLVSDKARHIRANLAICLWRGDRAMAVSDYSKR